MVGLNINMPFTCADCPCYQTLHLYNEKEMVQDTLVRRCAASKNVIKEIHWKSGDPMPDESWYDFTKPEWCPLIDLEHCN